LQLSEAAIYFVPSITENNDSKELHVHAAMLYVPQGTAEGITINEQLSYDPSPHLTEKGFLMQSKFPRR
jgi:hypothetical protein